jgi:hypothetical protein
MTAQADIERAPSHNSEPSDSGPEDHVVIPREAQEFSAVMIAALCLILILLAPWATLPAPLHKGWWVEPKTWPLLCLMIASLPALHMALKWWLRRQTSDSPRQYMQQSTWAFGDLSTSFEFSAYFCIYLFAVGYLGFAISSFLFMQFMIWRVGLRTWAWRLAAALFVVGLVLVFRVGIQLWFPMAPVLERMPDWFVQNIAIYM